MPLLVRSPLLPLLLLLQVKAGRELLEGGNRAGSSLQRALRFPGLLF